ncbi:MAG TPA: glycosyltransferase family A protein [Chryseolinea sp.]|nr:glycosyltransferase family A protein [Chryseolinea sp.]
MTIESTHPFFSVVIPVYNKEKYLARTIGSVLRQTFTNFELLLILDPSTDGSEQIAREFDDPRIRIFCRSTPGPGGYAARNKGITEAKADWVAFQDADDFWHENHLKSISDAILMEAKDVSVVCTSYVNEAKGALTPSLYGKRFGSMGSHRFGFYDFLLFKPISSINVAVKKQVVVAAGGFPESGVNRGGDHETWLRIMWLARNGFWIKEVTAEYNKNVPDGVIKSTIPLTHDHIVFQTVRDLLAKETDTDIAYALKRFSNSFVITGVRYRAKMGTLTKKDLSALFVDAPLKVRQLRLFRFLAMLPVQIQKQVSRFYRLLLKY